MNLEQAEHLDNYLKSIDNSYLNKIARSKCTYKEESNFFLDTINKYTKKYSIFDNIKIVQLHSSAENGYPHTRPNNIICIPSNSRFPDLETTLFHEVVHIHQRNNKYLWDDFLLRHGWKQYDASKIPQRWKDKCRLNPDTIYAPYYIFEDRYVPLPMFKKEINIELNDVNVMWYDTKSGILNNSPPESFNKKYGFSVSQSEHPFEIYAVILSKQYPFDDKDIFKYLVDGGNRSK